MNFTVDFNTKWADFDPNRHMRHTAYNDYAAEVRVRYFAKTGLSVNELAINKIGPILFEEHSLFKKEIHLGEKISVNIKISALSKDYRKWKIKHEIFNQENQLSAIVEVFGSWIDLEKRKIITLPEKFQIILENLEKTNDFEYL